MDLIFVMLIFYLIGKYIEDNRRINKAIEDQRSRMFQLYNESDFNNTIWVDQKYYWNHLEEFNKNHWKILKY